VTTPGADLCLLGGRIVPLAEARISPLDRGFLFGDAVYETVKVRAGRPLFWERHRQRLARSLAALGIPAPAGLDAAIERLVGAAGLEEGAVYLQISRGAAPERRHLPSAGLEPTLFALTTRTEPVAEPWRRPGLAAVTREDGRWSRCDVKTTALAATVLGAREAAAAGADEVLWRSSAGELREAGRTNLFVRDARGWHTHPLGPEILAGVTRAILLELAPGERPAIEERAPRLDARADWREAFLTGTTTGVRALVRLDGEPIGDGRPGAETARFARLLDAAEATEAARPTVRAEARPA
jgi:D-alanine transaminase